MLFHASGQRFVRPAHLSLAFRVLFMVWLALPLALWPSISAFAAAPASIPIPTDLTATPVSFQGSGGITLHGTILDPASDDDNVKGMRRFNAVLHADSRVSATVIQTVGVKGHDGFALALVI